MFPLFSLVFFISNLYLSQLAQAALCGTILSGALAERISVHVYLLYSFVIACILHPLVAR